MSCSCLYVGNYFWRFIWNNLKIVEKQKWRFKKRELLYWWVDYIKCFINEFENSSKNFKKLTKLSVNSNQLFVLYNGYNLSITSINWGKYWRLYSIVYSDISIWFIWLNWGQSPDMLEITGQGLTLFWENIFYFLFEYFKFTFVKFKRLDLCFDLELDINYFYDRILESNYKEKNEDWSWKKRLKPWISPKNGLETLEIWEKNIKKNSYSFIRIYNKILDSKNKWKLFLYEKFFKNEDKTYKNVTRFEIEMREDLVKKFDFDYLKNYDFQFYRIVKSFYNLNIQYFKFLKKDEHFLKFKEEYKKENKNIIQKLKEWVLWVKTNSISQDRIKKIIEKKSNQIKFGNDFIDENDKERTIKMFLSYWKRLFINGFSLIKLFLMLKKHTFDVKNDKK